MAFLAGLALACPAIAADRIAAAHTPFDWAGVYFGVQVGGGWGNHDRFSSFGNSYGSSGAAAGLYGGINWSNGGHIVWGVEADINATSVSGNDANVGGTTDATAINYTGTVNARVGAAIKRALVYVSGGFAFAGITQTNDSASLSGPSTLTGWDIGGGVDALLTARLIGRLSYKYKDYRTAGTYTGGALTPFTVDTQSHEVMAGLAVKLN